MIGNATLIIRLTPGPSARVAGDTRVNRLTGGPETLLRWLETQLGLPGVENRHSSCVTEYASALDEITDSFISVSLTNDRWATASEILSRRDELQLSGWDQDDLEGLPDLVHEMARAASGRNFVFPSVSDRLQAVVDALEEGQELPQHVCVLTDNVDRWPKRWQSVLARLNVEPFVDSPPAAQESTALRSAQRMVRGENVSQIELDDSLRYVQTLSQTTAVEYVGATLAHNSDHLERTAILCEDNQLAMQLDACLRRYGLPTMGASACSRAHPILQVLPLSLALCWKPVDPQCLLDFLTLPICPIPRKAANALANALTIEPGLGSSAWQRSFEGLCSVELDPEGALRAKLDRWLFCERVDQKSMVPTRLVRERCAAVAQWASSLAIVMETEDEPPLLLVHALQVAAGQASLLGELAQSQGSELSEPQLTRLIEEALAAGVEAVGSIEAEGGPIRVRSLSEITAPCHRIIWLGLGTHDVPSCRFSTDQLASLRSLGIDVDDGSKSLTSLRTAEARGLCCVEDALLAILLPQDVERRWHPLWLAIRTAFSIDIRRDAPLLESIIEQGEIASLEPFTFETESTVVTPPHGQRPLWSVDPALLSDRDTVSATELEDRLACPLKWVFRYRAQLRPSPIAQLPDDFRLKGSFCHKILEYAFSDGGKLPTADEAVARVERLFDERLELDAAPLAQSDKYREKQSLRKELAHATRVLIESLTSGGYRIKGIEVDVCGDAFDKPLVGSIDCLAENSDGNEGIIDFKYGGRKYERMIADGQAVQLATYAHSRSTETGRFPAVAYLVLIDGLLFTPSRSPIGGDSNRTIVDGPAIQTVWEQFQTAIAQADDWLTTNGQIPARPLQNSSDWPDGVRIVLDANLNQADVQSACRYCNYQHLCGIKQLT